MTYTVQPKWRIRPSRFGVHKDAWGMYLLGNEGEESRMPRDWIVGLSIEGLLANAKTIGYQPGDAIELVVT